MASLYSAHIDGKYWEESDSDGKIQRKDAFVSFSTGPRSCIGEPLARMEVFLFFTNLFKQFSFTPQDENGLPLLDGIQALTLTALPYHLVTKPR